MPRETTVGGCIGNKNNTVAGAVAVVVTCRERVLFGRRKLAPGEFEWQLPGGWIETGESPPQAARREVSEETGLELCELDFVGVTNNVFSSGKHSISLYFEAECANSGSLYAGERDKCDGWEWRDWNDVGENLYLPLQLLKQTEYQPLFMGKIRSCIIK